jgi:hypothetical protein
MKQPSSLAPPDKTIGQLRRISHSLGFAASVPPLPRTDCSVRQRQKEGPALVRGPFRIVLGVRLYESLLSRRRRITPVARSVNPIRTVTSSERPVKGSVCVPATAPAPAAEPSTWPAG